jgi:hypothetical protein
VATGFGENPTDDLQVSGYTMLSRAKYLEKIWVMQPFSQDLFSRGPPSGPEILMKKLLGELAPEDVVEEFEKTIGIDKRRSEAHKLYHCTHCFLSGRRNFRKPAVAFGANSVSEILALIVSDGAWTRCLQCREIAALCRASKSKEVAAVQPASTGQTCSEKDGLTCSSCKQTRPYEYFTEAAVKNRDRNTTRRCNLCEGIRLCAECSKWKASTDFRRGHEACRKCTKVLCAACGAEKES